MKPGTILGLGASVHIGLFAAACVEQPTDWDPVLRYDSVGVEIVESQRPTWQPGEEWRLSQMPVTRVRASIGDEAVLLDPVSIDVDSRGRIIVADGQQGGWHSILVFDADGQLIDRIGRRGQGPGEFVRLWWATVLHGDSLAAYDLTGGMRLSIFDPDGRFVRQLRVPETPSELQVPGTFVAGGGIDRVYRDGSYLAFTSGVRDDSVDPGPTRLRHRLLRVAPDGETFESMGVFTLGSVYWTESGTIPYWFSPVSLRAITDEYLYFGTTETFEVQQYRAGQLERVMRRTVDPQPVNEELKEAFKTWYYDWAFASTGGDEQVMDFVRNDLERSQFAENLPAYSELLVDDLGNVWVEAFRWILGRNAPMVAPAHWSVFDSTGVWLGDVVTPSGFVVKRVTSDSALGFMEDEFGAREIHVYRIEKDGAGDNGRL